MLTTVDYCKCILLYSPLNSYLYVHWILDFKSILLLLTGASSIRVISDDTDVFVLLLHFFKSESLTCDLVMLGTCHSRTSVDIKATAQKCADFVSEILAAHVVSGCDTGSYMWGIGKGTVVEPRSP